MSRFVVEVQAKLRRSWRSSPRARTTSRGRRRDQRGDHRAGAADRHPGRVRGGRGGAGQLVPASPRQPGAGPGQPVPHRDRAQPRALAPAEHQAILDTLHSPRFADLAPGEVGPSCWTKAPPRVAVHLLPAAARRGRDPRAPPPGHPSRRGQARTAGHRPEPRLVVGHHQAARPGEMDVLLPLRHPRHLLPLRRSARWSPPASPPSWPRSSSPRPAPSRASAAGSSPSTPTAAPR